MIGIQLEQAISYSGKHDVIHSEYGESTLKIIKEDVNIDGVILDNNMLGMCELECLKAIRKKPKFDSINVVMYTSESSKETIADYFQFGANAFFRKPFTHQTVSQIVHFD